MGEMADWAYDQMMLEVVQKDREIIFLKSLSQVDLIRYLKDVLKNRKYKPNDFTDMVIDMYMIHEGGHTLSDKQLDVICRHIVYQDAENWY